VQSILRVADALANHKNYWIAQAWDVNRPMVHLAAEFRDAPQEYLASAIAIFWKKAFASRSA